MYQRMSIKNVVAVIGLAALAAFGAWQFYLFVTFKNTQGVVDVQGGTLHLWLAIGIALIVCIAGVFLFSRLLRYDTRNEIHITTAGPPLRCGENFEQRTMSDIYAMRRANGDWFALEGRGRLARPTVSQQP